MKNFKIDKEDLILGLCGAVLAILSRAIANRKQDKKLEEYVDRKMIEMKAKEEEDD